MEMLNSGKTGRKEETMEIGYKEISPELLQTAYQNAWSIESRAEEQKVEYIGSCINGYLDNDSKNGCNVNDYYRDKEGNYWYGSRALLPSGELVSMERYLFGRDLKNRRKSVGKWQRRGRHGRQERNE